MSLKQDSSLVVSRRAPSTRLTLFCFPNAGGGAALLHSWLNGLPAEIEVSAIRLPGREKRRLEPPFVRMANLIECVAAELESFLDIPYALFGHSIGALMAFETARELRRRSLPLPIRLFASGHAAPQIPRFLEPIHQVSDSDFIKALISRYDAIPASVLADPELMSMFMPALRADLQMFETYAYSSDEPLDCPLTVLGGVQDPTVTRAQLEAWQQQTLKSFRLHMFPGKHFFLKDARSHVLKVICNDLSLTLGSD